MEAEPSAIESAGETLGEVREDTPKRPQAKMLKTIFQEVVVNAAGLQLVSVKPWLPFRMDGLEEREHGRYYACGHHASADEELMGWPSPCEQ